MLAARLSVLISALIAVSISPKLQSAGQSAKEVRWVTVSDLNGPISKSANDLPPAPLTASDSLLSGNTIVTGANANGRLRFINGTTIMIRGNSQLTLEELVFDPFDRERYQNDFFLAYGEIACGFSPMNHESTSRIRTPAGIINVNSGARFRVFHHGMNRDDGFDLELSVLEGRVAYEGQIDGAKRTIPVSPGTQLLISGKLDSARLEVHLKKEPTARPLPPKIRKLIEEIKPDYIAN